MRKKWPLRLGMLAACGCPYVFLGMYGDASGKGMTGYLPMLAWMVLACWAAVRTKNIPVLLAGNGLSFLASYGCLLLAQTERWGWYFKPFTALGFLKMASVLALLVQGLLLCMFRAGKKPDIKHKEERL